ncbi:hypothetical protein AgCh_025581 [Apium graveolens]
MRQLGAIHTKKIYVPLNLGTLMYQPHVETRHVQMVKQASMMVVFEQRAPGKEIVCNKYEFQMQYGSIGWSVGATLGYAQAAKDKRIIGWSVEIHDGLYNVIKNWNYTALVDAIHNGESKCWTTKVRCEEDLDEEIETATGEKKIFFASLK